MREIAERLLAAAVGAVPWEEIDIERAVPWVEGKTGLSLAPSQREAPRAPSVGIPLGSGGTWTACGWPRPDQPPHRPR